jgi:hypothetical protein
MVAVMINEVQHLVTGDYVSYLGDDNFYFPNRVSVYYRSIVELNADVLVGKVRWIMKSGARNHQDFVVYSYPEPLLNGHEGLCKVLAPSNFICHDSVMHKKTEVKWPEDNRNPPVDWRFWLELFNRGYRFKKINYTGEEAFFPGSWKEGLTMKQALICLEGITMKRKVVYLKNISSQVQKDTNGMRVLPGERIEFDKASYCGPNGIKMIFPGFIYDSEMNMPFEVMAEKPKKDLSSKELKDWESEMKPKQVDEVMNVKLDLVQEIEEKVPFELEVKPSEKIAEILDETKVIAKITDIVENMKQVPVVIEMETEKKSKRSIKKSRKTRS